MAGETEADALDMDEWLSLSDEQQEAELQKELAAYSRWYDGLSIAGQLAHRRHMALSNCRSARRLIRLAHCPEIIRQHARNQIKAAQIRLLKIRVWRTTGQQPGEA
ncbi:hypothetical protein [Methylobacterium aquaticum]|uniref:Uncharacterized protein n=1 Tax=Methylobacterium aquaticum TaxID=270351 RepID=A0A1Y0ZBY4_9HYPH|nr:hypothetical protein [Methylobacterium aquaticum]BAR47071.1 hypothetical protein Maq22A_c27825 [Methylobacterium aquaticum]